MPDSSVTVRRHRKKHEVNAAKTKYMLLSRHQNAGQDYHMKIVERFYENVSQFKYLGTTATNQYFFQEEIKSRFNSGNAWYNSVQNLLSSHPLSKNITIRIYKTVSSPVVPYGRETWFLTFKEEHRLSVFENRALGRLFGPKRGGVTGEWRKLHNEELCDSYSSLSTTRMVRSKKMRLT
jgi:hypothetical protein